MVDRIVRGKETERQQPTTSMHRDEATAITGFGKLTWLRLEAGSRLAPSA